MCLRTCAATFGARVWNIGSVMELQRSRFVERGGLEGEDHSRFLAARPWNTESAKQQRRGDHVADTSHFELRPVFALDATVELSEYLATKFCEDRRKRVGGQVRPQLVRFAEQGHERAGLSVHMKHATRCGKDDHTGLVGGRKRESV